MDRRKFLIGAATTAAVMQTVPAQAMIEIDAGEPYPSREKPIFKIQVMKRQIFGKLSKEIGFEKAKSILDDICMNIVRVKPPFILSSFEGKMIYYGLEYDPRIEPKNSVLCDHMEFDENLLRSFGYKKDDFKNGYTYEISNIYSPIPFYDRVS